MPEISSQNLIYKDEFCLFVWTLYKFTFLNRSEQNLAHISPLGLEEIVGYVWTQYVWTQYVWTQYVWTQYVWTQYS